MFEIKGDRPRWETVYDLFHGANVGDVITHDALSEALGYDVLTDRSPVYKATEVLQREDRRTTANVKGRGYRIAAAREHAPLAEDRQRRARRQIRRGKATVTHVNVAELTPAEARHNDAVLLRISALESFEASQRTYNIKMASALTSQDQRLDHLIDQLRGKGFI
ncbi:MAG TPA: hypothetical protein VF317_06205 [Dermatophilaceae bacterium]